MPTHRWPLLLVLLLLVSPGRAQDLQMKLPDDPFSIGEDREEGKFAKMLQQQTVMLTKDMEDMARLAARHLVRPLTHREVYLRTGEIKKVTERLERLVVTAWRAESRNLNLRKAFARELLSDLQEALSNTNRDAIVLINAARMLAFVARHTNDADTAALLNKLCEVADDLKKPKIAASRYYLFKAYKELYSRDAEPPFTKAEGKVKDVSLRLLVEHVEWPYPNNQPSEQLDGWRYLRREAIRALAELRQAGVTTDPKAHGALALARIAANDRSLTLEPSLAERVEALIGLSRLSAKTYPALQPDVVAYHIAVGLWAMQKAYNSPARTIFPWQVYCPRLQEAYKGFAQAHSEVKPVKDVETFVNELCDRLQNAGNVNQVRIADWIRANSGDQKLSSKPIYHNDKDAVVRSREVN